MILGNSELKKIAENHITSLNPYNIRASSIDLSLSEEVKVLKGNEDINLFEIDQMDEDRYETINLAKGYRLKPQSFMYGSTCEHVCIPDDQCGLIVSHSTFAKIGLILPLSSYANPGYEGHLPLVIFNASPSHIVIPPYIRMAQLLLFEVKGEIASYKDSSDSNYDGEEKLALPRFNNDELKDILEQLK